MSAHKDNQNWLPLIIAAVIVVIAVGWYWQYRTDMQAKAQAIADRYIASVMLEACIASGSRTACSWESERNPGR